MKLNEIQKKYLLNRTEVLLYVANKEETKAIKEKLTLMNVFINIDLVVGEQTVLFFKYHNYHVALLVGESIGGRACYNVISKVGKEFPNLQYVVNIGCCAKTLKKAGNQVIFAERVFDADLRKEEKDGTKYSISENKHTLLSNRINTNCEKLFGKDYKLIFGPIVASAAVVKSIKLKKRYYKTYPYAKAIEMEGIAISDYAIGRGIEWILIKGVSDNGVRKNGSEGQYNATANAFSVFMRLLEHSMLDLQRMKVFVGGAVKDVDDSTALNIEDNCAALGNTLFKNDCKIINGLGAIVGNSLVAAAYVYRKNEDEVPFSSLIDLYPFPRTQDKNRKMNALSLYEKNRNVMINQCVVSLFIYGRDRKSDEYNGLANESDKAGAIGIPRIVVPTKAFLSQKLYQIIKDNFYDGIKDKEYITLFDSLEDKPFNKQIEIVVSLLKQLDDVLYK